IRARVGPFRGSRTAAREVTLLYPPSPPDAMTIARWPPIRGRCACDIVHLALRRPILPRFGKSRHSVEVVEIQGLTAMGSLVHAKWRRVGSAACTCRPSYPL